MTRFILKSLAAVSGIALFILSFGARADFDFNGQAFVNSFISLNPDDVGEDFLQSSANVWVSGDQDWGNKYSLSGTLTASAVDSLDDEYSGAHLDARELYGQIKQKKWIMHLGRKMMSWGKADGINPTDVLSSHDYRAYVTDFEQRRLAPTGVFFEYMPHETIIKCARWKRYKKRLGKKIQTFRKCIEKNRVTKRSKQSFTLALVPNFQQSIVSQSTAVDPALVLLDQKRPEAEIENADFAAKWDYHSEGWEASVLGFIGHDHLPYYKQKSFQFVPPASFILTLEPVYSRLYLLGGSFSKSFSEMVFKTEGAYRKTSNSDGKDMLFAPSSIELVSGVERGFGEHHRLIAQGFIMNYPGFTDFDKYAAGDLAKQSVAEINSQVHAYTESSRYGFLLNWIFNNEDTGWKFESTLNYSLAQKDYFLSLKSTYLWTDALQIIFGTQMFGGDEDTPFGILDTQNTVFVETKYWF